MTLEEKLIISNNNIDNLLDEEVNIKIVCIINDNILLDSNKYLPNIRLKKGEINNNIVNIFNELLNISINDISMLPFERYNNYNERYYNIQINEDDYLNLSNNFSFDKIDNMKDITERKIVS